MNNRRRKERRHGSLGYRDIISLVVSEVVSYREC